MGIVEKTWHGHPMTNQVSPLLLLSHRHLVNALSQVLWAQNIWLQGAGASSTSKIYPAQPCPAQAPWGQAGGL